MLTCLSCKPRFSSRTEAFHREGGEVLERRFLWSINCKEKLTPPPRAGSSHVFNLTPVSAAPLRMLHRQDKNAALGWGVSPQQGWGPSLHLSILQGTSEGLREFSSPTCCDCCCKEADLSPGRRRMLRAAPSTWILQQTQPAQEAAPTHLFGSQQH